MHTVGPQVCFHEAPFLTPTLLEDRGRRDGSSERTEKEERHPGSGPSGQKRDMERGLLIVCAIVP